MEIIQTYSCKSLTLQTPFMQPSSKMLLSAGWLTMASSSAWFSVGKRLAD